MTMRRLLSGVSALALIVAPLPALANGGGGGSSGGTGSGTVSSISTSCGVAGGTITTTGTISSALNANAQTGTSYPFIATDCGKFVTFTNASAIAGSLVNANFTAGQYINIRNLAGAAGVLTLTPTSGLIDGAASLALQPGEAGITVTFDGTNWTSSGLAVQGPASSTDSDIALFNGTSGKVLKDSGIASALIQQSYAAATGGNGFWFPLWTGFVVTALGTAMAQNTARCMPFYLALAEHWDSASMNVTTLGTGPVVFSLYADAIDATTHRHQPQAAIASGSGSWTVTGTGSVTSALGVAGTGIPIPQGLNWICVNNTNAADAVRFAGVPATSPAMTILAGTATATNSNSVTQTTGWTAALTAGTWTSLAGVTLTESVSNGSPMISRHVVSTP